MPTDYNAIAAEYRQSKLQPWRSFIERNTLLSLIGSVENHSILDLACGEGHYSRVLRHSGAARVVGVDRSEGMIALARDEEARRPLGIEYRVQDAATLDGSEKFDLVVAAYLLNYASSALELQAMADAIVRSLKPDGRFVTVNNDPDQDPRFFASTRKYGFIKSAAGAMREGEPIVYTIYLDAGSIDLTNYWLSRETHEQVLRSAGFRTIHWQEPSVAPDGASLYGDDFWNEFLAHPPVTFLECSR